MAQPWKTIESIATDEGILELRQRGERDFMIMIGSQVLMNSLANRSEVVLGQLGCSHLKNSAHPRVLVGGLGMGFTLKAVLDTLPATAKVIVAELNPIVREWCRGPLAALTGHAVDDPRVTVEIGDVAHLIRQSAVNGGRHASTPSSSTCTVDPTQKRIPSMIRSTAAGPSTICGPPSNRAAQWRSGENVTTRGLTSGCKVPVSR